MPWLPCTHEGQAARVYRTAVGLFQASTSRTGVGLPYAASQAKQGDPGYRRMVGVPAPDESNLHRPSQRGDILKQARERYSANSFGQRIRVFACVDHIQRG